MTHPMRPKVDINGLPRPLPYVRIRVTRDRPESRLGGQREWFIAFLTACREDVKDEIEQIDPRKDDGPSPWIDQVLRDVIGGPQDPIWDPTYAYFKISPSSSASLIRLLEEEYQDLLDDVRELRATSDNERSSLMLDAKAEIHYAVTIWARLLKARVEFMAPAT